MNLNLGCPSGTVTAKRTLGQDFLAYPEELSKIFGSDIFKNENEDFC